MNATVSRTAIFIAVIVVLLSGSFPVYADSSTGSGLETPAPTPAALQPDAKTPVINVWYSSALNFGQIGNPQDQVNILGNVSDPGGVVKSLSYSLNGAAAMPLTIGPDGYRLVSKGDFNVAIKTDAPALKNGANSLTITAYNSSGSVVATKTASFTYTAGRTWPLPYTTNWAGAANISDQAQVVDGQWQLGASGVRPTQIGYDRVIAIGDINWTDYEVLVPITVYGFYPSGTDAGGAGVIVRWQGHTGSDQPPSGWNQIGAYAYYSNREGAWALRLNDNKPITADFPFSYNTTYLYKVRVESIPPTQNGAPSPGGRYSFKAWVKGQPEPGWSSSQFFNVEDTNSDMLKGSMLLVAHRADATFGDVTVCPLNLTYPLTLNTSDGGKVTSAPAKTSYACGEGVTLTAQPNPGWTFKGWSGDLASSSASLSFNMTKPYTLTANFTAGQPVDLTNRVFLPMIER